MRARLISAAFFCTALAAQSRREIEGLAAFQGSAAARALLLEQGFVVVPGDVREIFQPYIGAALPPFVTSDSAWRAFAVLLAEGIRQIELAQAPLLAAFCERLCTRLQALGEPELLELATVARSLLRAPPKEPPRVAFLVTPVPPHALVPIEPYSRSEILAGHWRARQWLAQTLFAGYVPRERELGRRLRDAIAGDAELAALHARLEGPWERLLGERTDEMPGDYRILPQRLSVDAMLFRRTTHPFVPERWLPSALEVAGTGPLASAAGRDALAKALLGEPEATRAKVLAAQCPPLGASLFDAALRALRTLQEPLPAQAPAALRTRAWLDKQLDTQLAAWAGMRHALALHMVETRSWLCMSHDRAGYVEPYPAFFAELAGLARAAARTCATHGGTGDDLAHAAAKSLLDLLRKKSQPESRDRYWDFWAVDDLSHPDLEAAGKSFPDRERELIASLEAILAGGKPDALTLGRLHIQARGGPVVANMLRELADLCDALARIARKELAGDDLDAGDHAWLLGYGKQLARLCLYTGNSYVRPRDDHPVVVSVAACLQQDRSAVAERLWVGTAYPELLWVVVDGVLHQGGVLAFREQRSERAWTDEEWRAALRTPSPPAPPAFAASYRRP